jgi:predicted secreted Zn-dependent protease
MSDLIPTALHWFKSSYSNGSGGECVECAHTPTATLARDSKVPHGPVLTVSAEEWKTFIDGVSTGQLG